jgi:hypothetical protein
MERERRTSCDDDIVFIVDRRVGVSGHFVDLNGLSRGRDQRV